jgi:hypothetical protein
VSVNIDFDLAGIYPADATHQLNGRLGRGVVAFPQGVRVCTVKVEVRKPGEDKPLSVAFGQIRADLLPGAYEVRNIPTELKVSAPFEILPSRDADVRAGVEAVIDQVLVEQGDTVRADQVVAVLAGAHLVVVVSEDMRSAPARAFALRLRPTLTVSGMGDLLRVDGWLKDSL